jgi:predicted nucleic acid-binding protein
LDVTEETILDTGPLVAFLDSDEEHHQWAAGRFKELKPNFLTCEAVLTEAFFLLGSAPKAIEQIDRFMDGGWLKTPFQFALQRPAVMQLMRTWRNVPISFADACLVRMSELHQNAPVFTLDKDFRIYRKHGRQVIETIMPD